jgi:FHA domain
VSVDEILLAARVAFVVALYLFLIVLALLLRRELSRGAATTSERAPGDLLVVEPHETGYEVGERIPLLSRSTIGRLPENTVVMDDTFVSGEHVRLQWNGKGWVLEDLDSTNGTEVNGQEVRGVTALNPGDTIGLGRVVKLKLVSL